MSELPDWVMPVDHGILSSLPKEGSRLGYHNLGSTVKIIRKRLNESAPDGGELTSGIIAQRITRWLIPNRMVVVVKVHGASGELGYQATEAGQRLAAQISKEMLA